MKFIRGIKNIPDISSGTVLTIGNFDGIHLGHQSIINRVRQKASEQGLPSGVVFFEPLAATRARVALSAATALTRKRAESPLTVTRVPTLSFAKSPALIGQARAETAPLTATERPAI